MKSVKIETPCGHVEGISESSVRKFFGIQYATAKRWEYATEVTSWPGVYQAKSFGAAPIQERAFIDGIQYKEQPFYHREFYDNFESEYSEDCLFLNIWTPERPENCPVLVVLYGGGMISGQSNEKVFDGTEYAKRGVILITLNFRVNIFGLFASTELKEKYGKCGNYALYDQLTAFQWIRRNVGAFGGDCSRMTLIGQSAGASCVETQIKAPVNRGVFQGAIIQSSAGFVSGLPDFVKPKCENTLNAWKSVFEKSGCKTIDEFQKLPTKQLFDLWYSMNQGNMAYTGFIPDDVFNPKDAKEPCEVNVLCGITSEDTAPAIFYWLTKRFGKIQRGVRPVYAYIFNRQLPGDKLGAWHSSDLWYTYGTLERCWRPFTSEDYELSNRIIDYFCNFVKTGNPNNSGLEYWEPLSESGGKFMRFDVHNTKMVKLSYLRLLHTTLTYKGPRM